MRIKKDILLKMIVWKYYLLDMAGKFLLIHQHYHYPLVTPDPHDISSSKLENELQFLFKDQLRAAGGTGTLSLSEYLATTMSRTGRRAVLP